MSRDDRLLLRQFLAITWGLALLALAAIVVPEFSRQSRQAECDAQHGVLVRGRLPEFGYRCIGGTPAPAR